MKQVIVDCTFRLPGEKPEADAKDIDCSFDPDRIRIEDKKSKPPADAKDKVNVEPN